MNRVSWWFDVSKPAHSIWFAAIVLAANVIMWIMLFPSVQEVYSTRKPVVILDIIPHQESIAVGEPYLLTVLFEKTRSDCDAGALTRHMWNVETGEAYLVEQIDTIVSDVGVGKITRPIPTHPLDESDKRFIRPGFWTLNTTITYQCPSPPDGEQIQRDVTFQTPAFEVRDR